MWKWVLIQFAGSSVGGLLPLNQWWGRRRPFTSIPNRKTKAFIFPWSMEQTAWSMWRWRYGVEQNPQQMVKKSKGKGRIISSRWRYRPGWTRKTASGWRDWPLTWQLPPPYSLLPGGTRSLPACSWGLFLATREWPHLRRSSNNCRGEKRGGSDSRFQFWCPTAHAWGGPTRVVWVTRKADVDCFFVYTLHTCVPYEENKEPSLGPTRAVLFYFLIFKKNHFNILKYIFLTFRN